MGCGKDSKAAAPPGSGAMPVKVLEAQAVPVRDTSDYVATLKSRDSAVIMPQVEGQIVQIYRHSGDRVSAGTPLWRSLLRGARVFLALTRACSLRVDLHKRRARRNAVSRMPVESAQSGLRPAA